MPGAEHSLPLDQRPVARRPLLLPRRHQLLMRPHLHHTPLVHHHDLVRARNLLQSAASADPRNTVIARDLKKAEAAVG